MRQFLDLAALVEQPPYEGHSIAVVFGDFEVHDLSVFADQPGLMEEKRRIRLAEIKVEMPAAPAIYVPGCFETVPYRLARAIAPDDLARSFKPGALALIFHDI
ncbi:hypothetical protein [Bosea rubneri]|uniref:Uncharacterized protein n=1 Tax=Bosea rubneri TaxID=3075434 RepID=A0ABU3SGW1_9HYPH|nr:hypothetical protein [Bosea sp. ZW T0_25]MDU0343954.1 hypothetical protein [Bosea sp. ZW T0_25]